MFQNREVHSHPGGPMGSWLDCDLIQDIKGTRIRMWNDGQPWHLQLCKWPCRSGPRMRVIGLTTSTLSAVDEASHSYSILISTPWVRLILLQCGWRECPGLLLTLNLLTVGASFISFWNGQQASYVVSMSLSIDEDHSLLALNSRFDFQSVSDKY